VIQIIEAAEMLGFVDTPKRTVVLEPAGREFVDANPERQRELWRDQVKTLPLFREIMGLLERAGSDGVPETLLLTLIDWELPSENLSRLLRNVIKWGRFGNLFEYDERTHLFRR